MQKNIEETTLICVCVVFFGFFFFACMLVSLLANSLREQAVMIEKLLRSSHNSSETCQTDHIMSQHGEVGDSEYGSGRFNAISQA